MSWTSRPGDDYHLLPRYRGRRRKGQQPPLTFKQGKVARATDQPDDGKRGQQ